MNQAALPLRFENWGSVVASGVHREGGTRCSQKWGGGQGERLAQHGWAHGERSSLISGTSRVGVTVTAMLDFLARVRVFRLK